VSDNWTVRGAGRVAHTGGMVPRTAGDRITEPVDFFISYSPLDELWATWIAWQLESAGFRTMLQAWDFVAGSNFINFMDRGVSESVAVVAVLSRHYMRSRYARMEWQAALRSAPEDPGRRLITVRVEDFPLEGLLATITFVDLVALEEEVARQRLLQRVKEAVGGRAKPRRSPAYPVNGRPVRAARRPPGLAPPSPRLAGRKAVAYPPHRRAVGAPGSGTTLLQLRGPMFGSTDGVRSPTADDLVELVTGSVNWWMTQGGAAPDALIVAGQLTSAGGIREFDEALDFLIQLRIALMLEPHRVAIVPAASDVTRAACRAYFASCEADEEEPREPFWPKWRHYSRFFNGVYEEVDGVTFDEHQPWTLFEMADLRLVVAGLNSTMADTHLEDGDRTGHVGATQARWFGQRLRAYGRQGWARVGLIADPPGAPPRGRPAAGGTRSRARSAADGSSRAEPAADISPGRRLRDADVFHRHLGPLLDAVLSGSADDAGLGGVGTMITIGTGESGFTVDDRPLMSGI
jgi:hypothetical protein